MLPIEPERETLALQQEMGSLLPLGQPLQFV